MRAAHESPALNKQRRTMTITNGVKTVHVDERVIGELHPYGENSADERVGLRDDSRRRSSIPKDVVKNVEVVELRECAQFRKERLKRLGVLLSPENRPMY